MRILILLLLLTANADAMLAARIVAASKSGALKSVTAFPTTNTIVLEQGSTIDNPTYAYADDASNTTQGTGASSYADGLAGEIKYTGFGFAIPGGATIKGITVKYNRYADDENNSYDYQIKLVKAGSVTGDNKSNFVLWPAAMTEGTYGGQADMWGTTWTPAQVNATNFGVDLGWSWTNLGVTPNIFIDYVKITIYYTE